jgi:signal transduction histidine kinase
MARLRFAVRERAEGQVLAEHLARLTAGPCVVVARRRDGWRVDGAAGMELPRVLVPPPDDDGALERWLVAHSDCTRWRSSDLLHGRRRVGRVFLGTRLTPGVLAACRAVEPYFAALDVPRDRAQPGSLELSALAHDLRQPLSSVRLWLTLMAERPETDCLSRCLATITRMDALIEDVLLLDPAQRKLDGEVDLAALVEDVAIECMPAAARRGVRLTVTAIVRPRLLGNRTSLIRALANIVHNAIAHGPSDAVVTITIGCDADVAFVEVQDEGAGVPEELRERVFAARFSTTASGSGLGLAVTRAVAHAHGGRAFFVDGSTSRLRLELPQRSPTTRAAARERR